MREEREERDSGSGGFVSWLAVNLFDREIDRAPSRRRRRFSSISPSSRTCVVRIHDDSVSGFVLSATSSPVGQDIAMRGRRRREPGGQEDETDDALEKENGDEERKKTAEMKRQNFFLGPFSLGFSSSSSPSFSSSTALLLHKKGKNKEDGNPLQLLCSRSIAS